MSHKNVAKVVRYSLVQFSSLIEKIPSTKILKPQIPKHKYQTNHNDRNSKYQTVWVIEKLKFICNLVLGTWGLIGFVFEEED